jgi:hypothetical protein
MNLIGLVGAAWCMLATACAHHELAPSSEPASGRPAQRLLYQFVLEAGPRAGRGPRPYMETLWKRRVSTEWSAIAPPPCGRTVLDAFRGAVIEYLRVGILNSSCVVRPDFVQCSTDFISPNGRDGAEGRDFVSIHYAHTSELVTVEDSLYELASDGSRIPERDSELGGELAWKLERVRNAVHDAARCKH